MESKRKHYQHCQICGEPIPFGWHCEACVQSHRVCQMCDADISHRSDLAQTCGNSCKEARKRGMRSFVKGNGGNVPETVIQSLTDAMQRLDALETRITQNETAVTQLVEQQKQTNLELQELNRNLSFFLTKLSDMRISPTTEPATIKAIPQAAPLDAPVFDDIDFDLDIKASEGGGKQATQNFMNSLAACQQW